VTVFVDVNVVPMDTERVLANQTVVVDSGRIAALGPANQVEVPAGAVRVDGRGKYPLSGAVVSVVVGRSIVADNVTSCRSVVGNP
jgi:cytosine/adenosine deaminase-related metal-dependent hydrolase